MLCCAMLCAGVKISDATRLQAAGVDTGLVAQRATEAYLMQVCGDSTLYVGAGIAICSWKPIVCSVRHTSIALSIAGQSGMSTCRHAVTVVTHG